MQGHAAGALEKLVFVGGAVTAPTRLEKDRMKVDISPKAVSVRLKRVSQLRRLCLSLAKSKPVPQKEMGRR